MSNGILASYFILEKEQFLSPNLQRNIFAKGKQLVEEERALGRPSSSHWESLTSRKAKAPEKSFQTVTSLPQKSKYIFQADPTATLLLQKMTPGHNSVNLRCLKFME